MLHEMARGIKTARNSCQLCILLCKIKKKCKFNIKHMGFECGICLEGFLFLLVFMIGCVILLWYSLGLPYNYMYLCGPFHQTIRGARKQDGHKS